MPPTLVGWNTEMKAILSIRILLEKNISSSASDHICIPTGFVWCEN